MTSPARLQYHSKCISDHVNELSDKIAAYLNSEANDHYYLDSYISLKLHELNSFSIIIITRDAIV